MAARAIITLLTDFGMSDPYVAAMKGVILSAAPDVQLVDLCHDVPAHDVLTGAFVLAQAAPYYPPGTVHVVVIDPGVGTGRRVLAARLGGQTFLVPDNGVIGLVARRMPQEAVVAVRTGQVLGGASISATFHGRDVFAPLAARIAGGLDIEQLGPQTERYARLEIPSHVEQTSELAGEVIYIDRFGNLVSNIPERAVRDRWGDVAGLRVLCGGRDAGPFAATYAQVEAGRPLALFNSMELLELAVNQGSAQDRLGAAVGTEIRVRHGGAAEAEAT